MLERDGNISCDETSCASTSYDFPHECDLNLEVFLFIFKILQILGGT